MPENSAPVTELTSQYVSQVTTDLEHNLKEQERISAEIAALQEQLATLQHDHAVLLSMQQALGVAASATGRAVVPAPRKKTAAAPGARKAARKDSKAKDTKAQAGPGKRSAEKETPQATRPTLVELVRRHLTEQTEPRSATEVTESLGRAHADRDVQTKVVRTTLENLVARNHAQRVKQGNSVYYTVPRPAQATAAAEGRSETA
ncbi:hypothetical protein ACWEN3_16395 [Streptomyces sp. NPDC004561]